MLYRVAEMLEARAEEFAGLCTGREEVERSVDRIVWYAGWADKLAQVIGSSNPVAGPYFNFTVPEPTGVVAVLAPEEPPLLGLVTRLAPAIVGGNAAVVVASESRPLAAVELAEVIATSDVPGGVVNVLTGFRAELAPVLAGHMDVNAIDVAGADGVVEELEQLAAENVKRVVRGRPDCAEPVGGGRLPRAQDRLAPGRPVAARSAGHPLWRMRRARPWRSAGARRRGRSR